MGELQWATATDVLPTGDPDAVPPFVLFSDALSPMSGLDVYPNNHGRSALDLEETERPWFWPFRSSEHLAACKKQNNTSRKENSKESLPRWVTFLYETVELQGLGGRSALGFKVSDVTCIFQGMVSSDHGNDITHHGSVFIDSARYSSIRFGRQWFGSVGTRYEQCATLFIDRDSVRSEGSRSVDVEVAEKYPEFFFRLVNHTKTNVVASVYDFQNDQPFSRIRKGDTLTFSFLVERESRRLGSHNVRAYFPY